MKIYQLVHVGRHPKTHELFYNIECEQEVLFANLSYQSGYSKILELMNPTDKLQEIDGEIKSKELSYSEVCMGDRLMNTHFLDSDLP